MFWLKPGTLVFNIVFAWERAVAVVSEREAGMIGSHRFPTYEMVRGRGDAHFLKYYFTTGYGHFLLQQNSPGAAGRNKTLNQAALLKEEVRLPSAAHQRAIADFLDRKTTAIDALIEKKQRLLGLLAEKRAALINQAVTKGLDPSAPMKDSGIPWIGEIPAHWVMHRLRRVVRRFVDYRGRTPEKVEDGIPLITAGAVRDGKVDHTRAPEWVSEEVYGHLVKRGRPEMGDLLFTSEAPLGEVGLIEDPHVACAQRIIMFKVERMRVDPSFLRLHFLSASGRGEICSRASGSTAEGIRADRLKMSLVPTPPVEEQKRISDHVAAETHGFKEIAHSVVKQIDRLQEYRQALITAAVTGQLGIPEEAV